MAHTNVFGELSNRINQKKRSDSGIHNSIELPNEHGKTDKVKSRTVEEQADSGRDSDHVEGNPSKKSGLLKSFKKMFKQKKKASKTLNSSEENLSKQYKAKSDTDILTSNVTSGPSRPLQPFYRYNSEVVKSNIKVDNSFVLTDDEGSRTPEKKDSLKEVQNILCTSLRKLKMKRKKSSEGESPIIDKKMILPQTEVKHENLAKSDIDVPFDDSFYTCSISHSNDPVALSPKSSINLGDISNIGPKIETSVAKDKIRIAPKDRRKPSKFCTPPAKKFNSDPDTSPSLLTKIVEDGDPLLSRKSSHSSNEVVSKGIHGSSGDVYHPKRSSLDRFSGSSEFKDKLASARLSSENISGKSDNVAQRSQSTNSRENINMKNSHTKPWKPQNSINGIDMKQFSRSTGVLNKPVQSDIFFDKDSKQTTSDELFNKSFHHKHSEYEEMIRNLENVSNGKKSNSFKTSNEHISNPIALGDVLKRSRGNNSNSKEDISKRSKENLSRSSREDVSMTSKEDIFKRSKEDFSKRNMEDVFRRNKEEISKIKEVVLSKSVFSENANLSKECKPENDYLMGNTNKTDNSDLRSIDSPCDSREDMHIKENDKQDNFGATFAITSPKKVLESPKYPIIFQSQNVNKTGESFLNKSAEKEQKARKTSDILKDQMKNRKIETNFQRKEEKRPRPKSVKIIGSEISHDKKDLFFTNSKSMDDIFTLDKSIKPATKERPTPSPRKDRLMNKSPPITDTEPSDTGISFNRICLKKVPKLDDFLEKSKNETATNSSEPDFNKISLKKVAKKDDFLEKVEPEHASNLSKTNENINRISLKKVAKKDDFLEKVESQPANNSIEYNDSINRTPLKKVAEKDDFAENTNIAFYEPNEDFNRIPLRHVEKKGDILSTSVSSKQELPFRKEENASGIEDFRNKFSLGETNYGLNRTKSLGQANKPKPLTAKPKPDKEDFSFQSKDVIIGRTKSLSSAEMKPAKSTSPTSDKEQNDVPSWIKIANRKQKNEDNSVEGDKTENTKDSDSSEINVKPSAVKQRTSPKPDVSSKIISPPPSHGTPFRPSFPFNANSDLKINQCIVCGKSAYMFERCEVDKHTIHKTCAKCVVCHRTLKVGEMFIVSNKIYCSHHKT